MREVDLLIIGAGPAGLAAAFEAKAIGIAPVVIDENPLEEAWFRRQIPLFFGDRAAGSASIDGNVVYRWLERPPIKAALEAGIEVLPQHASWGVFKPLQGEGFAPVTVGVHHGGETSLWSARQLIIATGAADLPFAFPGWELGGVLGGLGALRLFDTFGRLDAQRMVVAGSGALAAAVVGAAEERGIEVVAVVEIGSELRAGGELFRRQEPFVRHTIRRAEGRGEVERVVLAPVDDRGTPVEADGPVLEADTLVLAAGGQPAPEIPFMARCEVAYGRALGGAHPRHDAAMRTSHPHVLVAGDAAGMPDFQPGGIPRANAQGRLAAIGAAEGLGRLSASEAEQRRKAIEVTPQPPDRDEPGAYHTPWHRAADLLAADDVHLCRCEQVTKGVVTRTHGFYVSGGFPDEVKRYSRAGMGFCQGRLCRPIIGGTIAALNGEPLDGQPLAAWRPPVRPVPIAALATEEETDFDRDNELEAGAWIDWWFLGNYEPRDHARGEFSIGESLG
jgi:pyruvate/2-oxoglutarate dehydrogenase complex dihydrolipoamide dehydrogenase (E3) component